MSEQKLFLTQIETKLFGVLGSSEFNDGWYFAIRDARCGLLRSASEGRP